MSEGANFAPSRPVVVMGPDSPASTDAETAPDELFQSLVREGPGRGEALRNASSQRAIPTARLTKSRKRSSMPARASWTKPRASAPPARSTPGFARQRIAASAAKPTGDHREVVVDLGGDGLERVGAEVAGPVEELIEIEDDADLELLVSEVSSSLSERRRDVLALHGAGCKRSQIAERLGLPERIVKRDIEAIMDEARATLARLAGGGCERGEPLVMRLLCGISDPAESAQAREHLSHCGRCELFSERLIAWREKAGAMLPPRSPKALVPESWGGSRSPPRSGWPRSSSMSSTEGRSSNSTRRRPTTAPSIRRPSPPLAPAPSPP